MRDLDITPKMARVLKIFLEAPDRPRYLYELTKLTKLPTGGLFPMLSRLEEAGWLTSDKEPIDPAVEGRPARRNYVLTDLAIDAARMKLAELSEQYRPPVAAQPRMTPDAGMA